MKRQVHMFWAAMACLVVAWSILYLGYVLSLPAVAGVPLWLPLVLLFAAGGMAWTSGVSRRSRTGVAVTVVFAAMAIATIQLSDVEEADLEPAWADDASRRIAVTLDAVAQEINRLERLSTSIGENVAASAELRERYRAFEILDSLASDISSGGALPSGTKIGIQLFEGDERVAWAGWPQSVSEIDRIFIASGHELVYSREVSLYRILTHIIPIDTTATVLVDMPLEVNFRVNNRFLKSTSLADNTDVAGVSNVTFGYFPVTGNMPDRLERFAKTLVESREQRAAMLAGDRQGLMDSILTYFPLPDNVFPIGEVAGDPARGLSGRVVVRSPQGNPVLSVTAVSRPFRHYLDERHARFLFAGRTLIILALLALFALAMLRIPAQRFGWARAALFVGCIAVLRYSLLAFQTVSTTSGIKIFDPTVFATPAFGGIMRSAGDLLLTAVFLVVALYGILKLNRAARNHGERAGVDVRPWHTIPKSIVMTAVILGVFWAAQKFTATVVVNANPRLIGDTMNITSVEVLVLHLSIFLMLTAIILIGIFLLWGMLRVTGWADVTRVSLLATGLIVAAAVSIDRWDVAVLAILIVIFVVFAPRFVQREDLVSIVIVSFFLVIVTSGTAYRFIGRDYDDLRKSFVIEKSDEILNPSDNWKVVILEDVLGDYAARQDIRQALRNPASVDVQRLAFDLWASGPLSFLGYSCAIHVVTERDSVVSEFAVDMPYRVRITEGSERTDTPEDNQWVVLDVTRQTPQGIVRSYRGIMNIREEGIVQGEGGAPVLGKVIVDLPFFFENLDLASRTGPRTPEVLRNVQEGGVAPRIEEPEALLLARVSGGQLIESSSEYLPVGSRVTDVTFQRALEGRWPLVRAPERKYRIVALGTDNADQYLVAGFVVPSLSRHLLLWSTLLSLYLFFTFAIIVAIILLGTFPHVKELLPTLTPGRRLGFQQKLLASFLVVALVPAIILGVFSVEFIKNRFVEENRQEAQYKALSARKAFANLLHAELQFVLGQVAVSDLFESESSVRKIDPRRILEVFDPSSGEEFSADDLYIMRADGKTYIGVFSSPVHAVTEEWTGSFYVYYGRLVDGELLGEVAEQVGADVNIYDDGELVASSREGLLAGGFISSIMNSDAFVKVALLGSDRSLATERAGSYDYQVAYLPLNDFSPRGVRPVMSVPLVFRPESYYLEVQKATSIVLGIFALLLAATIALGLFLARGIFEPLRALLAGTRRIGLGDFNVRIATRRRDEIGAVVGAFNEMTQKIAESQTAMEERRRYLETILENIGTGVISTDTDDRIRTVNAAAERILGVAAARVTGKTAIELVNEGVAPAIFALVGGRDAPEAFVAAETELSRDGRVATIKYMRTRLDVEARYQGTVFVCEDLTELIRSKKLSAWVEMARQIAHEIKNPLTPIRISTQFMLRAYEQKPEQFDTIFREGTQTIMQQVDVLKRIAGEFSSYGRMQQLDISPHQIEPMIRNILTPYENNETGVRIRFENGVAEAAALVDPEAVRKITANLIENALEAMPGGGELVVTCRDTAREFIGITFRDTGPGLNEEATRKLFEPYFSTKTTGTGLGLAICRTLSQEMGGDVNVENCSDGAGVVATFTVRRANGPH